MSSRCSDVRSSAVRNRLLALAHTIVLPHVLSGSDAGRFGRATDRPLIRGHVNSDRGVL